MNIIEQTVEPKNGAIDLHIPLPEGWDEWGIKVVVVYEKTDVPIQKSTGTGLSKYRSALGHLPLVERLAMQKELDDMRDEWERPIL